MEEKTEFLTKNDIFWLYIYVVIMILVLHITFPVYHSSSYCFKELYNISDYIVIDSFSFMPDKIPVVYEYCVSTGPLDIYYEKTFILKDFSNIIIQVNGKAQINKKYLFLFVKEFGANYSVKSYVEKQLDNIFLDINKLTTEELIKKQSYYRYKINHINFKFYNITLNMTIRKKCN